MRKHRVLEKTRTKTLRTSTSYLGVGFVLQQTHIFPGSIFENVRYGNLDATDEEVIGVGTHHSLYQANEHYRSIIDANIENMNIEQLLSVRKNVLF